MLHGGMHPLAKSPALLTTFLRYEEDEGAHILQQASVLEN